MKSKVIGSPQGRNIQEIRPLDLSMKTSDQEITSGLNDTSASMSGDHVHNGDNQPDRPL